MKPPTFKKPSFFPFFKKKSKDSFKNQLPKVRLKVFPGPKSQKLTAELRRFECPQITYIGGVFPVFFKKAQGINITDVDGNRFIDLTSAFAVTSIGHSHKVIQKALIEQSKNMIHGMGDIHPNEEKVLLAKKLSEITPGNLNQTIFSSTGFEAVETALKTAVMHTKKTGVIAFTGAYHGLGYGTLSVTHREDFRKPFLKQLGNFSYFAPYPDPRVYGEKAAETSLKAVRSILKKARRSKHPVGCILIEPIQGRGGIVVPPQNFLKELRALCDEASVLLIADEVFTGFGRTGTMFAVDKSGIVPDLLCLGKGMGGGFPISACIGTTRVMFSWGVSTGDSVHTSTFLGNPLGSSVALAVIKEIEDRRFVDRSKQMGEHFRRKLHDLKLHHPLIGDVRGAGLMIGMELVENRSLDAKSSHKVKPATAKTKAFIEEALKSGLILLPSGLHHNVISITPPFVISEKEIDYSIGVFDKILKKIGS